MNIIKACNYCKLQLPLFNFSKDSKSKDGVSRRCKACHKLYREANKERFAEKIKVYREVNKERIVKHDRARYEANKHIILERGKLYRELHKDKIAAYQKENPGNVNARMAKRRASKISATPNCLTKEDFIRIAEFYVESQRLEILTGVKHHVDHIVPLQGLTVCGLHVPWNLQVITAIENMRKSNKFDG